MEGRFEVRREELLAQAQVSAADWDGVTERLEAFVEPFVAALTEAAQRRHLVESASGLLSNLERSELARACRYESRNILPPLKNQLRT